MHTFFFQAEDGIRVAHYGLEFRRVLFRSPAARDRDRRAGRCDSDWASGAVRASDLGRRPARPCRGPAQTCRRRGGASTAAASGRIPAVTRAVARLRQTADAGPQSPVARRRSEEHTSALQSLMRISYAVFCLKKIKETTQNNHDTDKTQNNN